MHGCNATNCMMMSLAPSSTLIKPKTANPNVRIWLITETLESSEVNALDRFLLACIYTEVATKKKPLRYFPLPLLKLTIRVLERYDAPPVILYEYREDILEHLRKGIIWVSLSRYHVVLLSVADHPAIAVICLHRRASIPPMTCLPLAVYRTR